MKRVGVLFVLLALLSGCATFSGDGQRTISKVITGDLTFLSSQTTRFAIYPSVNIAYLSGDSDRGLIVAQYRESIRGILVGKGYTQVPMDGNPDFIVGFGLGMASKISDEEIFDKTGLVVGLSADGVNAQKFQKGTVLVALFLPGSSKPQWQAQVQGFADMKKSDKSRREGTYRVLETMMDVIPSVKDASGGPAGS